MWVTPASPWSYPTHANDGSDGDAVFRMEALPGDGYTVDPSGGTAIVVVRDVDPLPVLGFRSNWYDIPEAAGTVELSVDLTSSLPVLRQVEVDYEVRDVAAANDGEDFTASTGTLVFAPGETSKTIEVPILQDNRAESDEQFTVELKNPLFADLEDGQTSLRAIVAILDDEPTVSMASPLTPITEGTDAVFNFTRTESTSDELTIWVRVLQSAPDRQCLTGGRGVCGW